MNDFHHQRFNVLVCTTIIETGIDIPTANTIIIERADHFGLAQLHQLRGRVGRSHHRAYARLLTPHPKAMTTDAQSASKPLPRWKILAQALRWRPTIWRSAAPGAAGRRSERSDGDHRLLPVYGAAGECGRCPESRARAVAGRSHQPADGSRTAHAFLLPDDFIPDVNTRLSFYKRIASAKTNRISRRSKSS